MLNTDTVHETLDVLPEGFSEGELININEESGDEERMEVSQKKWQWQKSITLKEFLKKFHDTESKKDNVLEADSHLVGNMATDQSIKKILAPNQ